MGRTKGHQREKVVKLSPEIEAYFKLLGVSGDMRHFKCDLAKVTGKW